MPKVEDVCPFILHFEGEEVFGSSKYKLEILIGSEGDSHRLDKVNFSYPWVQTKATLVPLSKMVNATPSTPHVKYMLEKTSKWHIARISIKSKECRAIQL